MTGTDESLMAGARNAIGTCLGVTAADRVWILTDDERFEIGEALAAAAHERAATVALRRMEAFGARPFVGLPDAMVDDLHGVNPTVTVLATSAQPGEIRFRLPFARLLRHELQVRHAHMIGVTPDLMRAGMRADYTRVAELTFKVTAAMQRAREVHVQTASGTELRVELDNDAYRWVPFSGLIHQPGAWSNLPEGETCTFPGNINGTLHADLLGDYFCSKYGPLHPTLAFHIKDGWLNDIDHPDATLTREVWSFLNGATNGRRVGEFAVGTNEALHRLYGNLLQDEKIPGVHVAFGHPLPEATGAEWTSDIHVDAITLGCSIWVDGEPLMEKGRFLL